MARDDTFQQLIYTRESSTGWFQKVVDPNPAYSFTTLVLENNLSKVLYIGGDGSLKYAYSVCPSCDFNTPENIASGFTTPLTQPDLTAHPTFGTHVAYVKGGSLFYTQRLGIDSWTKPELVDSGSIGKPLIELDPAGQPHLVYRKGSELLHTYRIGTVWQPASLMAAVESMANYAFKISPQGTISAVYSLFTNYSYFAVTYLTRVCLPTMAPGPGTCYWSPSPIGQIDEEFVDLALDSQGAPHIAYLADFGGELTYVTLGSGGVWIKKQVDSRDSLYSPVIAISPLNGRPRIAYSDWGNRDLNLAFEGDQVFLPSLRR